LEGDAIAKVVAETERVHAEIDGLKFSTPRLAVAQGIATMKHGTIDADTPAEVEELLQAITPPEGHPFWSGRPKPKRLMVTLKRMAVEGLVELKTKDVGDKDRKWVVGSNVVPQGFAYGVRHGAELTTRMFVDFVRLDGNWPPETINKNVRVQGPERAETVRHRNRPWQSWAVLVDMSNAGDLMAFAYEDRRQTVPLADVITAITGNDLDAATALRFLSPADRKAVVSAVLKDSGINNPLTHDDDVDRVLNLKGDKKVNAFDKKVARLEDLYAATHTDPDGDVVELICQAAWMRARAQIDRMSGTQRQPQQKVSRVGDWRQPPRKISSVENFVKRERATLAAVQQAAKDGARIQAQMDKVGEPFRQMRSMILDRFGDDASFEIATVDAPGHRRADAVVYDEGGRVVAEVEMKVGQVPVIKEIPLNDGED